MKKKEYFIDESNTSCLFFFKEVLALHDKKENTKFLEIFKSIPMVEKPTKEII